MSISVVYWSGTGNTQAMAEAIGEGIEENGAQAKVMSVDQASVDALAGEDVFALGCSAMGAEELEEGQQVYLQNEMGQPFPVTVVAKEAGIITFDANHEMAGKELNFKIELVEIC